DGVRGQRPIHEAPSRLRHVRPGARLPADRRDRAADRLRTPVARIAAPARAAARADRPLGGGRGAVLRPPLGLAAVGAARPDRPARDPQAEGIRPASRGMNDGPLDPAPVARPEAWIEIGDPGRASDAPLVSVLMLAYQHGPYLAEAIEGVLDQRG